MQLAFLKLQNLLQEPRTHAHRGTATPGRSPLQQALQLLPTGGFGGQAVKDSFPSAGRLFQVAQDGLARAANVLA